MLAHYVHTPLLIAISYIEVSFLTAQFRTTSPLLASGKRGVDVPEHDARMLPFLIALGEVLQSDEGVLMHICGLLQCAVYRPPFLAWA